MSDPTGFVTVFSSFEAWEVHLVRHRLEQAGIPCFIADENVVSVNWLYGNALGGIKLRVRSQDAERAQQILQETPPDEPA